MVVGSNLCGVFLQTSEAPSPSIEEDEEEEDVEGASEGN